jgi:hypothetical protein
VDYVINGWKMWGVPAPSVCVPPGHDTEATVCGYAPTVAPVRVISMPPVRIDAMQDIETPPLRIATPGPARVRPTPQPSHGAAIDPTEPQHVARGLGPVAFHWASPRERDEPCFEFSGDAADDSELTFIGKLDIETHDERGASVLTRDRTSWILAAIGVLGLSTLMTLLLTFPV